MRFRPLALASPGEGTRKTPQPRAATTCDAPRCVYIAGRPVTTEPTARQVVIGTVVTLRTRNGGRHRHSRHRGPASPLLLSAAAAIRITSRSAAESQEEGVLAYPVQSGHVRSQEALGYSLPSLTFNPALMPSSASVQREMGSGDRMQQWHRQGHRTEARRTTA